jgi:hypothetical protein
MASAVALGSPLRHPPCGKQEQDGCRSRAAVASHLTRRASGAAVALRCSTPLAAEPAGSDRPPIDPMPSALSGPAHAPPDASPASTRPRSACESPPRACRRAHAAACPAPPCPMLGFGHRLVVSWRSVLLTTPPRSTWPQTPPPASPQLPASSARPTLGTAPSSAGPRVRAVPGPSARPLPGG